MIARRLIERLVPDIEDVAANFIEQEVGRYDWRRNWKSMRKDHDMVEHARSWLSRYSIHLDPQELITWIDEFVDRVKGNWIG